MADRGTIAMVFAMPMELAPLRRRLSLTKTHLGALEIHEGSFAGRRMVATVTGMGTAFASTGATRLLDAVEVERVLVVGITGALEDETPLGTLMWPETVVNGNTGAAFHPTLLGDAPAGGIMWTTDNFITDAGELAELRERGVISLDMETAAIAAVCDPRGIPWTVYRVLSDRATDGNDELFALANQDGTTNAKAVAAYVLKHPGRVPVMAAMAKETKRAAERAVELALDAVAGLADG